MEAMKKDPPFLGGRLLVFTAHPDDEGLAAGTMHANHEAGGSTVLICATYGEKGKSHLERPVTDATLKKIRKEELLRAAKVLHVDKVVFFGLPDAGVRAHYKELLEKGEEIVKKEKPDYILSFGPEGVSAHWDHITVGRAARRIAKKRKIPLFAFTLSDEAIALRRKEFFLARRKFGKYAGIPALRSGDIKVRIDAGVKAKAMRSHVSQFGDRPPFSDLPKSMQKTIFGFEHFVSEKL